MTGTLINTTTGKPTHDSHNLSTRGKLASREEALLSEIRQAFLDPQVPIVTLLRAAGVGKTALAVEVIPRLIDQDEPLTYSWHLRRRLAA